MPTLGWMPLARPTFDVPYAEEMAGRLYEQLQQAGYDLVGPTDLVMDMTALEDAVSSLDAADLDLLVMVQATFADSSMALYLAQQVDVPLLMWAIPEPHTGGRLRLNSLCGINLAGHALTRAGHPYHYLYAAPEDSAALDELATLARAGMVKRRLGAARIGRIGQHPDGFPTCQYDPVALQAQLGLEVVQLDLNDVFTRTRQADPAAVGAALEQVKAQMAGVDKLDATATRGTLGAYVTLRDMATQQDLHGLAVRCWPEFFTEAGCAACGAMSMLSDGHVPCSCEADVNGTITQLMLQWLSDEPAFGTDIVSFDVEEDIAIVWHCGLAPLAMADPDTPARATIHSNRQLPLLMEFPLKPGRVTVARLSEASGQYRLVIGGGQMLKAPPGFTGTTGTLRFDSGAQAVLDTIMGAGLEHHISITYGDHTAALHALAQMLDLDVLTL